MVFRAETGAAGVASHGCSYAISNERAGDTAMEKLSGEVQWPVGVGTAGHTAPCGVYGDLFCVKHQFTCSCENSLTTLAGTSASLTSLNSNVMLPSDRKSTRLNSSHL